MSAAMLVGHATLGLMALVAVALLLVGALAVGAWRTTRALADWLRCRAAAQVLARRRGHLGRYFGEKTERQVVSRVTSTSEPAPSLPTESREQARQDLERAAARDRTSERLAVVWERIKAELATGGQATIVSTHPARWPLVYAHGHLCAVGSQSVERWDVACGRWFLASTGMAEAARAALGAST